VPGDEPGRAGGIATTRPVKNRSSFRDVVISRLLTLARVFGVVVLAATAVTAQDQAPNRRDVTIVARDFQFIPSRIEVVQDELVRITLSSEGRPYSFALDAYRVIKRAGAGQTIVFDFRADQAGTFTFYCNLTSVPQCKDMKGTLVVAPK
jgi:cytochrome c oxidase subunit 2